MWGQLFQGCPFLGRERAGVGTLTLEWEGQSMGMPVVLDTDVWWGKLWVWSDSGEGLQGTVHCGLRVIDDGLLWEEGL